MPGSDTASVVHLQGLEVHTRAAGTQCPTMAAKPHYTRPDTSHAGSSEKDILKEPDWARTHGHRIGFRDRNDRNPGLTHHGEEWSNEQEREFLAQARKEAEELGKKLGQRDLLNVREFMTKQEVCARVLTWSSLP